MLWQGKIWSLRNLIGKKSKNAFLVATVLIDTCTIIVKFNQYEILVVMVIW